MKKIICLTLFFCLICGSAGVLAAPSDAALFDVTSLGIMKGGENGELRLDEQLTRGEFAEIIVNLSGMRDAMQNTNSDTRFSDVDPKAWYASAVALVTQTNLMNGTTEDRFEPEAAVTYEQAIKTMVILLGYGAVANEKGGYPNGYLIAAQSIGLTKGVGRADFNRGELVTMIYNALDIDVMVQKGGGANSGYEVSKGQTLRSTLMEEGRENEKYQGTGIVTANGITWLGAPVSNMKADQVEIDGIRYEAGQTNAAQYLGMEVDYFAELNLQGTYTLLSVRPTVRNEVQTVKAEDIISSNLKKVEYMDENEDQEQIWIADQPIIVKNGVLVRIYDANTLKLKLGNLKLIDNNGDGEAEIVFINSYVNVRVDEVKEEGVYLTQDTEFNGSRFFEIRVSDKDTKYILEDAEGKTIRFEDIKPEDILSIFADEYLSVFRVVVCSEKVEGTVDERSNDEVRIGDRVYKATEDVLPSLELGSDVVAYLDCSGYIASVKTGEIKKAYGYIVAVHQDGGIGNTSIKMITGKTVASEIEKNEQNKDDKNEIPILVCQNESVEILKTAEKVRLDGTQYSSDQLIAKLRQGAVKYSLDADGRVKTILTAELAGGEQTKKLKFNVRDRVFGGVSGIEPFAVGDDTKVICIPDSDNPSKEDYLMQVRLDNRQSGRTYEAQGYELDLDTGKVKLMVIKESMSSSEIGNININSSKIGMVVKKGYQLDEEGEERLSVTVLDENGEKEYIAVEVRGENQILNELATGDLIYYNMSNEKKMENARIIYSFGQGVDTFFDNIGQDNEQICGPVEKLEFGKIDNARTRLATKVTLRTNGGTFPVLVAQRNTPPVFIYRESRQTIQMGQIKDINPGTDMVFISIPYDAVKACVIVKP